MATIRERIGLLTANAGSTYRAARGNAHGLLLPGRSCLVRKDFSVVAVGSIVTGWTPASGKTIVVYGLSISLSAAANLLLEDNAAASFLFRTPKLLADTPYTVEFPGGLTLAAADNLLKLTSSAAANLTGTIWGEEV